MKFTRHLIDKKENGQYYIKLSENQKWAIWIFPVLFGFRVQVGQWGKDFNSVDYCAGSIENNISYLYTTVEKIMENFDEDTPVHVIEAAFPKYNIRPIHKDTVLIKQLIKMSGVTPEDEDLEEVPPMSSIRGDFGLYELWEKLNIQPNENNGIIL
jgi:hypothetical protein